MAQNFGSNFLRGFQPNFANMFDNSYKASAIQDERERQRQEQEKARQQQLGILSQLFRGTKNVPMFQNNRAPLTNAGQSFTNNEVPLSSQEQFDLRAQLSPSSALSFLDSQNKPKQKETVKVGNQLFLENPLIKGMPMGDVLFTEPKATTTEDFVKATDVKGLENFGDYLVNRTTIKNPDGTETVKYGQPFTWKRQNININTGEGTGDLSKETTSILNKYAKSVQSLEDALESVKNGGRELKYNAFGMPDGFWSLEGLQEALATEKGKYKSFLNRNISVGTQEDWNGMVSQLDMRKPESLSSLWNTVHQTYIKSKDDEYDDAWYKEMQHKFISEFSIDPVQKFRK